jgi:hypothetical protein
MAIACLRLLTFLPLLPLLSVPRLRLRMVRSTSLEALREYRRAMTSPFLRGERASMPQLASCRADWHNLAAQNLFRIAETTGFSVHLCRVAT